MDTDDIQDILDAANDLMRTHHKSKDEEADHCAGCLDEFGELEDWPCPYAKIAAHAFETLPRGEA